MPLASRSQAPRSGASGGLTIRPAVIYALDTIAAGNRLGGHQQATAWRSAYQCTICALPSPGAPHCLLEDLRPGGVIRLRVEVVSLHMEFSPMGLKIPCRDLLAGAVSDVRLDHQCSDGPQRPIADEDCLTTSRVVLPGGVIVDNHAAPEGEKQLAVDSVLPVVRLKIWALRPIRRILTAAIEEVNLRRPEAPRARQT